LQTIYKCRASKKKLRGVVKNPGFFANFFSVKKNYRNDEKGGFGQVEGDNGDDHLKGEDRWGGIHAERSSPFSARRPGKRKENPCHSGSEARP